jgi:multicomponent K+:H+ antiporter subunit A
MPVTGALAIVASAAMAGVPLLNGFLSKEMFFAETVFIVSMPMVDWGLPLAATLAGAFAVVYSLRFGHGVFFGAVSTRLPHTPHEPPRWMRVPIELLVLACLVVGIAPAYSIGPALDAAARPVVGGDLPQYDLALWHGFNTPLAMSLIAMVGGLAAYRILRSRAPGFLRPPLFPALDGQRLFERALALLTRAARRCTAFATTRRLQPQLFLIVVLSVLAALASMWDGGLTWGDRPRLPSSLEFTMLWSIGSACAVGAAVLAKFHRLAALVALSVTGLMTCLTFVWFSAPDLALTQLAVETVTMVLFLIGLRWMPKRVAAHDPRITLRRARDLALAIVAGAGLAALSYAMLTRPVPHGVSPYFLGRSLSEGGGTNVINVMLVDFRSLDTLGEITVLATVAIAAYALLRRFRPPMETMDLPRQQRMVGAGGSDLIAPRAAADVKLGYMMVPAVLARLVLPIAGVVAAYLFIRGHNQPGGGFVAGLVVAIALITQYLVAGAAWVESRLVLNPVRWIGMGLACTALTGAGALALGYPFLTTHTAHLAIPVVGDVHVPSATLFDAGVFAVVLGSTLLTLIALAHQSIRARRRPAAVAPEASPVGNR